MWSWVHTVSISSATALEIEWDLPFLWLNELRVSLNGDENQANAFGTCIACYRMALVLFERCLFYLMPCGIPHLNAIPSCYLFQSSFI
uniref:PolyU-specific endoribonuclease-B n=1 Tax=Rhizophora mucronata TaxID=61149 RepID=A0A2P2JL87_RHIMU